MIFFIIFILVIIMTTINDPLELISLTSLMTISPYEIIKIFPILDKIKELKSYRIKLNDEIILNIHKKLYISLNEIVEDAEFMFNNFEEFIDIYDMISDYPNINHYIPKIKQYKVKFLREFSLLLSTLPSEILKELREKNKSFEEIENDIIKKIIC